MNTHWVDKTILRPPYLHKTGKRTYLYWIWSTIAIIAAGITALLSAPVYILHTNFKNDLLNVNI